MSRGRRNCIAIYPTADGGRQILVDGQPIPSLEEQAAEQARLDAQTIRAHNYAEMHTRAQAALKWIAGERAIANNVFPPGHSQRKKKLGERVAMQRFLEDVALLLDHLSRDETW